jgi:hypothetical protein
MTRTSLAVLIGAATFVGCQRSQDRTIERIAEKAIAEHGREATVKIDRQHGAITVDLGAAVEPAEWPKAVPFYPHASKAKAKAGGHELSITTDDSVDEVVEFYRRELTDLGWRVESSAGGRWQARRGGETLDMRISSEGRARETRAEISYRSAAAG